ncbi:hypothetical protein FXO37_21346 [Capsicum annuum]|nr:hypothetical protein FXO37_21346 [Capsicum annuum]
MNPINLFPKRFSQLIKFSQIRIASTQLIRSCGVPKYYSSDDQPPEKPPAEFPAAPQPNKPSESSEVPSAPEFDDHHQTPETQKQVLENEPYGSRPAIPKKGSKSKVRQPHGAQVKTPIPPVPDDMLSS